MEEKKLETILFSREERIAWIYFNRADVHNAFNARVIDELNESLENIKKDGSIRVLILSGKGKSFCAGADLNWMRKIIHFSYEQNLEESRKLAEVLYKLYSLKQATIARVNGATIGGGTGFLCACDIAISSEEAVFGLSEVKIGLVPAAISPYVLRKIGEGKARELFLTGERITAQKALEIGLVNRVVPVEKLDDEVRKVVELLLSSGPEAIASCKELIEKVPGMTFKDARDFTARMIADLRVSEEGQEGMAAFLEKRKPNWAR